MAEWGGLENRCGGNFTGGSNPSPSARKRIIVILLVSLFCIFVFQETSLSQSNFKTEQILNSPFGFHTSAVIPFFEYGISGPFDYAVDIGVKWERPALYFFWMLIQPDVNAQNFDWSRYDRFVKILPDSMMIMGNIAIGEPRRDHGYSNYAKNDRSFVPKNTDAYKRFVKAVVRRYDGDGIDDMPGLKTQIKHWQIDNEPPHGLTDYAEFLSITYDAIKEANPDAKVIIGGVPGLHMPQTTSEYKENFDKYYLPILKDLAAIKKRSFDIFDFHWYGDAKGDYKMIKDIHNYIKQKIAELRIPSPKEYWITEMGTYSGDPKPVIRGAMTMKDWPYQTEKQQAIDLVKRYIYPLSSGIKKIFMAFGLKEGFRNDEGYFDFTGFIYDGKYAHDQGKGVKKLACYTYKKMVEVLEGSDWNNIQTIQEKDGIYIYKFTRQGKPIWVAWNDNKDPKQIVISGITAKQVKITETVPKYESGKDVKDYISAFRTEAVFVNAGNVSYILKDIPLFIEYKSQ